MRPFQGNPVTSSSGLSDSNRTILDAKALHLVLQWVERCLERCRLMRHGVRGLERCQLPGENLSDRRRNKQRLIDSLWTQIPETRQKLMQQYHLSKASIYRYLAQRPSLDATQAAD